MRKSLQLFVVGFLVFGLIVLNTALLCSCTKPSSNPSEKESFFRPEDTNLEFWLGDNWLDLENSTCQRNEIYFENLVYYGTGYTWGDEQWVMYFCEHYPTYQDYDTPEIVTTITIADPSVYVWGLTLNNSWEEFIEKLSPLGFVLAEDHLGGPILQKGDIKVSCNMVEAFRIYVTVKNRYR